MPITDEQRLERMNSLGSSDSPAVVGVSPWSTSYDIYLSKTEELYDITGNEAVELGNDFEIPLLKWAAAKLGIEITINVPRQHPEDEIFTANLDALAVDRSLRTAIEAKFTGLPKEWGEEGTDQVPDQVLVQATHQMYVADLDIVWVPVLLSRFDRPQRRLYKITRTEDLVKVITSEGRDFWENHVVPRTPPTGVYPSLDVVKRIHRIAESTAVIDPKLASDYEAAKEVRINAEHTEGDAKALLLAAMEDCEAAEFGDDWKRYTYFEQTRKSLDSKRLRAAHPEIYKKFEQSMSYRVLRRANKRSTR